MFTPAENMQIDENALNKIAEYLIVRYKIDEDVRDIPVD